MGEFKNRFILTPGILTYLFIPTNSISLISKKSDFVLILTVFTIALFLSSTTINHKMCIMGDSHLVLAREFEYNLTEYFITELFLVHLLGKFWGSITYTYYSAHSFIESTSTLWPRFWLFPYMNYIYWYSDNNCIGPMMLLSRHSCLDLETKSWYYIPTWATLHIENLTGFNKCKCWVYCTKL